MAVKPSKLTMMRKVFCAEYVADPDFNATQAAIRAGFSAKSAKVKACMMLQDENVQAEIERLSKGFLYQLGVTTIGIVSEAKKIAYSNMLDFGTIDDDGQFNISLPNDRSLMAAVQEVVTDTWTEGKGEDKEKHTRTRLKLANKMPAIELLGRRLNAFPDRVEVGGKDGGPIHFTVERMGIKQK